MTVQYAPHYCMDQSNIKSDITCQTLDPNLWDPWQGIFLWNGMKFATDQSNVLEIIWTCFHSL